MSERFTDERINAMIRDAYHDVRLGEPLARARAGAGPARFGPGGRPARRRGPVAALAAAAATAVVTVGSWAYLTGWMPSAPPGPGGSAVPGASGPVTPGKPSRPSSTATTAPGRCADYVRQEAAAFGESWPSSVRTALPPLRFEQPVAGGSLSLLLFADDTVEVACWLTPDGARVTANASDLTTGWMPHPAGRLSYSSAAYGLEPLTAYAFGRVPPGTTRVEIALPSGAPIRAQLAGEWFLAWASGTASGRFAEATTVTAYRPGGAETLPIQHG